MTKEDENLKRIVETYAILMEEVRARSAAISAGNTGNISILGARNLNPILIYEFCFLQIRMICELIALGCLVAHGEVLAAASDDLQFHWSAQKIFDELGRLHAGFFPHAMNFVDVGSARLDGVMIKPPMSKADFLALYGRCGDRLHRGAFKKLSTDRNPTATTFPEIGEINTKLIELTREHTIFLLDGKHSIVCRILSDTDPVFVAHVTNLSGMPPP